MFKICLFWIMFANLEILRTKIQQEPFGIYFKNTEFHRVSGGGF